MKRLFSIFFLLTTISISAFAENYGGRAEVFVSAFGLLTHQTSGNAINAEATKAGGGSGPRQHGRDFQSEVPGPTA